MDKVHRKLCTRFFFDFFDFVSDFFIFYVIFFVIILVIFVIFYFFCDFFIFFCDFFGRKVYEIFSSTLLLVIGFIFD